MGILILQGRLFYWLTYIIFATTKTFNTQRMKKYLFIYVTVLLSLVVNAQNKTSEPFKGTIGNAEYKIYLTIDLYNNSVTVPGQELFGKLPGFLGDSIDSRKWLITSATIKKNTARLEMTNDYGSEDLIATLTQNEDNSYTFKQITGSNIKIARNRKWQKLPKELLFFKKDKK